MVANNEKRMVLSQDTLANVAARRGQRTFGPFSTRVKGCIHQRKICDNFARRCAFHCSDTLVRRYTLLKYYEIAHHYCACLQRY